MHKLCTHLSQAYQSTVASTSIQHGVKFKLLHYIHRKPATPTALRSTAHPTQHAHKPATNLSWQPAAPKFPWENSVGFRELIWITSSKFGVEFISRLHNSPSAKISLSIQKATERKHTISTYHNWAYESESRYIQPCIHVQDRDPVSRKPSTLSSLPHLTCLRKHFVVSMDKHLGKCKWYNTSWNPSVFMVWFPKTKSDLWQTCWDILPAGYPTCRKTRLLGRRTVPWKVEMSTPKVYWMGNVSVWQRRS